MDSEKYIGLDVHQATISVAVMDSTGRIIMESILEAKAATVVEFFAGLRGTRRNPTAPLLSIMERASTKLAIDIPVKH